MIEKKFKLREQFNGKKYLLTNKFNYIIFVKLKCSQAAVCDSFLTAECYSIIIYKTNGILLAIV